MSVSLPTYPGTTVQEERTPVAVSLDLPDWLQGDGGPKLPPAKMESLTRSDIDVPGRFGLPAAGSSRGGAPLVPEETTDLPTPAHPAEHRPPRRGRRIDADAIIRRQFTVSILEDLLGLKEHCRTPRAAMYAGRLLTTIRTVRDVSPEDPYTDLLLALHDALAYDQRWVKVDADMYQTAHSVVRRVALEHSPGRAAVERAIAELEQSGFITLPFQADLSAFDEEDDVDEQSEPG